MNIRKNYNHTLNACYLGYITQAIVNNFAPLLFLTFQSTYEISLDKIALLVGFCRSLLGRGKIPAGRYAGEEGTDYLAAGVYNEEAGTMVLVYKDSSLIQGDMVHIMYMTIFLVLAARRHPRYLLNRKSLRRLLKRKGGRV